MEVKEIERKLLTTYRKEIYRPFVKGLFDYGLVEENDHICVCISGGKDSLTLAKCMQEFERHGKVKVKCEYVLMDPGYLKIDVKKITDNAKLLGIDLTVVKSDIFKRVKLSEHKSPCYVCAKMRRGCLYETAKKMGCNKIALGHHFDDVITTTMLSILYGGIYNTMPPKIDAENFKGMKLIRPLYLVREKSISSFIKRCDITIEKYKCPLRKEDSKRKEVSELISNLSKTNKFVEYNIFKSAENVEVNNIRGIIENKKHVEYKEYYERISKNK